MDTGRRLRNHVIDLTTAIKAKTDKLQAAVKTVSENRRNVRAQLNHRA